jgi:hypothetical protein
VASVSRDSTCNSVEGSLTLFTGPNSDENFLRLTGGILREIQSAMDQDLYVSGSIDKVNFMGQKGIFLPPTPDPVKARNQVDSPNGDKSGSTAIIALILLVTTVVFVVFLVRKGKNNIKCLEDISTSDDDGMSTEEDENPKQTRIDRYFPCVEGHKQSMGAKIEPRIAAKEPEEEYLRRTLALARSLSTEPIDFSYHTYEGDGSDDVLSSAASSSQGGLHLVDDEDDNVFESLRRVTEIDFSYDQ